MCDLHHIKAVARIALHHGAATMPQVLEQCHAIFPDKPAGMSLAEYEMHINNGQCARLLRGECHSPCQTPNEEGGYSVDFDHILAKSQGGQNSGWNLEPKCSNYNQWVKGTNPDKTFENTFYFDQQINHTLLRENQNTHGFQMVRSAYKSLFECPSKELQCAFILLAWMVGTGKSIGMVAILHAINEVINAKAANSPRIRKVLWLVHQESLVRSIKDEVENEPVQYGILCQKPNVSIVEKSQDWPTATQKGDYVFACTQSLWDRQNAAMTALERAKYLSQFDAIVIDECHYAIDRYIEILQNAPRALKFVMTATPMDDTGRLLSEVDGGKYRSLFRLFSAYGYQSARSMGFVKEMPEWGSGVERLRYIPVEGGDSEFVESGQVVNGEKNTLNRHNNPRANAIIKRAIDAAQSIKEYPAHVMVRCESIVRLKSLLKSIEESFAEYFPQGSPGWGVKGIWSGSPGKKINDSDHPWMIVKKYKRLDEKSARLLLAVDMGQFGLNNPYCAVIAWTHPNYSIIEIVQRIGRAGRIVLKSEDKSGKMVSVSPDDQYIVLVFTDDPDVKARMEFAIKYIRDMESRVSKAFIPLDCKSSDQSPLDLSTPISGPLAGSVQYQINEMQGVMLPECLSVEDVEAFVDSMGDEGTPEMVEQICNYIEKISSESYKDKQFGLPESAEPLHFVFEEECKKQFTRAEMEQYAKANYSDFALVHILNDLDKGHSSVVTMLTEQLIKKHTQFHRPSGKFFPVQSLLGTNPKKVDKRLDRATDTYFGQLKSSFKELYINSSQEEQAQMSAILSQKLYVACAQAFGLPDFKQHQYVSYEAQLSSVMCSPGVKSKILHRAKALVIEELRGKMPGHYALYVNQILQFLGGPING